MQFDGIVYQEIAGIPMGNYCAPLIADLFLCRLRNIATHRDHFVRRPSVCPSVTLFCQIFQSYVSQATHAFLGMLPLFLFCYERDFMSDLHKSKRRGLIDMLMKPLDILTIYSPSITLNLRNIFLIYIPQNLS